MGRTRTAAVVVALSGLALTACRTTSPDVVSVDAETTSVAPVATRHPAATPSPAPGTCEDLAEVAGDGLEVHDVGYDDATGRLDVHASVGDFVVDVQDDAACMAGSDAIATIVRNVVDENQQTRHSECAAARARLASLPPGRRFIREHGLRVDVTRLEAYRDDVCSG